MVYILNVQCEPRLNRQLAVPIIYMLLWSKYNYRFGIIKS